MHNFLTLNLIFMAIITNGPLGQFRGRIGNLVFYPLNGKQVARTIGPQGPPSVKQLANYQRMSLTVNMLRTMNDFVDAGFAIEAKGTDKNPQNLAVSFNKSTAIYGEYPDMSIDYSKVIFSHGKLPFSEDISVTKSLKGLSFSWSKEDVKGYLRRREDMVMILVYFPGMRRSVQMLNAAKRESGGYELKLHRSMIHQPMEIYMLFKAANGKDISDTLYLGNINGPGNPPVLDEAEQAKAAKNYAELEARFEADKARYHKRMAQFKAKKIKYEALSSSERSYERSRHMLEIMPGKPESAG